MTTSMYPNVTAGGVDEKEPANVDPTLLVYMAFSLATVAECLLAGYLSLTSPELKRRQSTLFSGCLVLSIGILASLSLVYVLVLLTWPGATYRSPAGCRVRVVQRYLSLVSCYTLASLSLDRYLAICWPLRYQDLLTKARCHLLFAACWVLPAVLLLLPCIGVLSTMCKNSETEKRLLVVYVVTYTLGAFATLVLYFLVALEFCQTKFTRSRSCSIDLSHAPNNAYRQEVARVRHRTAKSALAVIMLYTIFSLPHTILPVVARIYPGYVPKAILDVGYLVHRFHLLLFLPMYAGTNVHFLASLSAWWKVLWRRFTCKATAMREITRPKNHASNNTQDDIL